VGGFLDFFKVYQKNTLNSVYLPILLILLEKNVFYVFYFVLLRDGILILFLKRISIVLIPLINQYKHFDGALTDTN